MIRRAMLSFVACLLPLAAHADDIAASVRTRLAGAPVVRGEFEQTKTIAGFRKPLVSHGDFLVARDQGVIWETRTPFAGTLKLTRKEIVSTSGDQQTLHLSTRDQPQLQAVNALLFAVLAGEVAPLEKDFTVTGSLRGAQAWQLALEPKNPAYARAFTRIALEGDRFVRKVEITEQSGDRTEIRLLKVNAEPPQLSAEEAKRFE